MSNRGWVMDQQVFVSSGAPHRGKRLCQLDERLQRGFVPTTC